MYEIEKGISIPVQRTKNIKYPFRFMEVGDSFFVAVKDDGVTDFKVTTNRVRNAASGYAKRDKSIKFTIRTVDGGIRCWMVK